MSYADNLRKAIINTGKVFTEMVEEVTRKQNEADREELDTLWQQALIESIKDGEQFTRYHFANLVAAAEREACAQLAQNRGLLDASEKERIAHYTACSNIAEAIRARGVSGESSKG
jgi:hypothetical protein